MNQPSLKQRLMRNLIHGGDNREAKIFHFEAKELMRRLAVTLGKNLERPEVDNVEDYNARLMCQVRDKILTNPIMAGRQLEIEGLINFFIMIYVSDLAYKELILEIIREFLLMNPKLGIELRPEWWKVETNT